MQRSLFILLFAFNISSAFSQHYKPTQHFVFPKVDIDSTSKSTVKPSIVDRGSFHQYIFNYAYTTCMDTEYNVPVWVSHHINKSLLTSGVERGSKYPKDPQYKQLKADAYASSGYDHGHLAPAADFAWDSMVYHQSFLMTNMSPQHGCFNQKGWCHLEGTVRKWAEDYKNADIYIVSGAVTSSFIDTLCYSTSFKVYVPEYYYKVVLIVEPNKAPKAIGFLIPNTDISNSSVPTYQRTVREIEQLTHLDFFSFLPRATQDAIETVIPSLKFYDGKLSCPDKSCESIYPVKGNRKRPENRTVLKCTPEQKSAETSLSQPIKKVKTL